MLINGETQIIGFFGSTYKTSKMYAMYNAAFRSLGLNFIYVPFVVSDLEQAVLGISHLGIRAVGITIPYKVDIIKYLDELDQDAKRIGAVNAVVNEDGVLKGVNTDGKGAVYALSEKTSLKDKRVLLLGAGGAGRAIAVALVDSGAKIIVVNRTPQDAKLLAKSLYCEFGKIDDIPTLISDADIVINSTSVGMVPNNSESLIAKSLLKKNLIVMDLVTNPMETKLLRDAVEMGSTIIYGDRMLFWQAVLKFKLFTGYEAPIDVMEKALIQELGSRF